MSNNKQQTAVDLAFEKLANQGLLVTKDYKNLVAYREAKEMEKEKQKYFFDCGRQYQLTGEGTFNEVYKETFGADK
jgi:hypothetical protein